MTLKLDIASDLEQRILEEARRHGLDATSFVLALLREKFEAATRDPRELQNAELLEEINRGFHPQLWHRYSQLIGKRDDGSLSPEEHEELLALSDQMELAQARRLELLSELASRRKITLRQMMDELGIRPLAHA